MMGCRRMRGVLAASVYGELTDKEQRALDRHVASCDACRRQVEAFRALSARIPRDKPELGFDLLPQVRQRLIEQDRPRHTFGWRLALSGALAMLIVSLIAYGIASRVPPQNAQTVPAVAKASPVELALREADSLVQKHDYTSAYRVLVEAARRYPQDPSAGQAQIALANVAYEDLGWYEKAQNAYETLRKDYLEAFNACPERAEIVRRMNLLAEARKVNYESLNRLEVAQRSADAFEELETVIVDYPATSVASLAADAMSRLVSDDGNLSDPNVRLAAMATAQDCCTQQAAAAQFQLMRGLLCWEEFNDYEQARELLEEVTASGEPALIELASASLQHMEEELPPSAGAP